MTVNISAPTLGGIAALVNTLDGTVSTLLLHDFGLVIGPIGLYDETTEANIGWIEFDDDGHPSFTQRDASDEDEEYAYDEDDDDTF